ncbi:MAG: hypothetical protein BLM47_04850 [Candidatus Reconcilbacillus cellulovorans]|uniref:Uncharacterized protein n=1 Tax=Candidatus Reconcilbacillus cellulovorans TaxID=1906605 RepID=A0A2A6E0I6_9BACL|nr:MAG: hypothetical protein BLM47_04850 [Candidatus Reconcilbacillus cellulovorans]
MFPPCVDWLALRLAKLEEDIRSLKEDLRNMLPLRIGNITYKIQEMNVRELSGTLHVGVSALGDEEGLKTLLNHSAGEDEAAEAPDPAKENGSIEGGNEPG